jgi:hypothetical protein
MTSFSPQVRIAGTGPHSPGAAAGEVAVQAGVYALMYADLPRENGEEAPAATSTMLAQRASLGLSRNRVLHLREECEVLPVVTIGPGHATVDEVVG